MITIETNGSMPNQVNTIQVAYIPSMSSSPCAKLMMRMTPKMIVSPIPMSA